MIDFHTHILPGIDDGSRDVPESLEMFRMESDEGARQVVATPHFYAYRDRVSHFLRRREIAYHRLSKELSIEEAQSIMLGAEVAYFTGIGDADMVPELTIQGTDMLLLEMPFAQWDDTVCQDVEKLLERQKLRVIIAHIERYYSFQKDRTYWDRVFDGPVIPQMNAGTFYRSGWLQKRRALDLARRYPIILGSDCHGVRRRPPNLSQGRQVLEAKLGTDYVRQMDERSERMFL